MSTFLYAVKNVMLAKTYVTIKHDRNNFASEMSNAALQVQFNITRCSVIGPLFIWALHIAQPLYVDWDKYQQHVMEMNKLLQ